MMQKTILLALHEFFPTYYTGTETLVLEVADQLKALGHRVAILTTEPWHPLLPINENSTVTLEEWQGHTIWRLLAKTRVDPVEHLSMKVRMSPCVQFSKKYWMNINRI